MKCWWLEITLKSDMCAATGGSDNGLTDHKTALEYGMPIIQAKRLKGCLLNEAKEMASNHFAKTETLNHLFGKIGSENPGSLYLEDAHLYRIPGSILGAPVPRDDVIIEQYEQVLEDVKYHPDIYEHMIEDVLTRTRTRTAIDRETGTAQKKTLRTMQVVPRGMVFKSRLELREPEIQGEVKLLNDCVKALRHIGLGITRGFGEVSCILREVPENLEVNHKATNIFFANNQVQLDYEIYLRAPALFAGETGMYEDCSKQIPGSALMGAFAAMYIKDKHLGFHGHQDEAFRRIFLRDGVQFGCGFLKREGKIFYPCPAFVVQEKNIGAKGKTRIMNRLPLENESKRRKDIDRQVSLDIENQTLYLADVEKEVRMHHARPVDRGMGHAQNDRFEAGATGMGQFFQYTSLSKGQHFCGTLKGSSKDLKILLECAERRGYCLSLGRSRTAEYGRAEIRVLGDRKSQYHSPSKRWLLWLLTPMLLVGNYGEPEPDPDYLRKQMEKLLKCTIEIKENESILKITKVAGYNSKWRLPMPQYAALSAGSVLSVEAGRELYADELESVGWGDMTGRGYGQIKVLPEGMIRNHMEDFRVGEVTCGNRTEVGENALINALLQYKENCEQIRKEIWEAMDTKAPLPNMATISKLIQLMEDGKAHTYRDMADYAMRIKDQDKQKAVLKFLEPCKNRSEDFIKAYLDGCKWKARLGEGVDHGKRGK